VSLAYGTKEDAIEIVFGLEGRGFVCGGGFGVTPTNFFRKIACLE